MRHSLEISSEGASVHSDGDGLFEAHLRDSEGDRSSYRQVGVDTDGQSEMLGMGVGRLFHRASAR
jgi:hypothetical protein